MVCFKRYKHFGMGLEKHTLEILLITDKEPSKEELKALEDAFESKRPDNNYCYRVWARPIKEGVVIIDEEIHTSTF